MVGHKKASKLLMKVDENNKLAPRGEYLIACEILKVILREEKQSNDVEDMKFSAP